MTLAAYGRLLRGNRNFRRLWYAQIVSETGDWFYSVAIFSFLLEATGSAQMVAVAFVLQVLPQALASPAAGVICDRLRRRSVMLYADYARAAVVLGMLFVRSAEQVWLLFILLFLETIHWALFEPARSAVIPNIVTTQELPTANALGATTWSINFALGSAIGGLVTAFFGREAVFILNSLSFLLSAAFVRGMRFEEPHTQGHARFRPRDLVDFSPIVEGLRYIAADGRRFATTLAKSGVGLIGSNWVIIPLLGERVFPIGGPGLSIEQKATLGMSVLMAARGVGTIGGAFLGGTHAGINPFRCRMWIITGFLMAATGYVVLGIAGSLAAACLALGFAHAGTSAVWTASTTLLQQQTEDRYRGRVFSAELAFSMLLIATSGYSAGRLGDSGLDARALASWTGVAMFTPAIAWMAAQRLWRTGVSSRYCSGSPPGDR